jgi:hypothetical protein
MNSFILEGYAEPNPYVKLARGLPAKPAQRSTNQNFIEKDSFDIWPLSDQQEARAT